MTSRAEVLILADQHPDRAVDLLVAYEHWFRTRADRQAARYWAGAHEDFAMLAAEGYRDADALRRAYAELSHPSRPAALRKGDRVLYHGSQTSVHGELTYLGQCGCWRCPPDRSTLEGYIDGRLVEIDHVRFTSFTRITAQEAQS